MAFSFLSGTEIGMFFLNAILIHLRIVSSVSWYLKVFGIFPFKATDTKLSKTDAHFVIII